MLRILTYTNRSLTFVHIKMTSTYPNLRFYTIRAPKHTPQYSKISTFQGSIFFPNLCPTPGAAPGAGVICLGTIDAPGKPPPPAPLAPPLTFLKPVVEQKHNRGNWWRGAETFLKSHLGPPWTHLPRPPYYFWFRVSMMRGDPNVFGRSQRRGVEGCWGCWIQCLMVVCGYNYEEHICGLLLLFFLPVPCFFFRNSLHSWRVRWRGVITADTVSR